MYAVRTAIKCLEQGFRGRARREPLWNGVWPLYFSLR